MTSCFHDMEIGIGLWWVVQAKPIISSDRTLNTTSIGLSAKIPTKFPYLNNKDRK